MNRTEKIRVLAREFPPYEHIEDMIPEFAVEDDIPQWLLVEANRYDSTYCLSVHASRRDAADYHDNQEYPEDWSIKVLVDLDTDERYGAVPSTRFEKLKAKTRS